MKTRVPADLFPEYNAELQNSSPRVVIIYDQMSNGRRAMRMLARAFGQFEEIPEYEASAWRLDLLEERHWASAAREKARQADVIVLAVTTPAAFSTGVKNWIESCVRQKQEGAAVIVLMQCDSSDAETKSQEEAEFLQRTAAESGLDFIRSDLTWSSCNSAESRWQPVFRYRGAGGARRPECKRFKLAQAR